MNVAILEELQEQIVTTLPHFTAPVCWIWQWRGDYYVVIRMTCPFGDYQTEMAISVEAVKRVGVQSAAKQFANSALQTYSTKCSEELARNR